MKFKIKVCEHKCKGDTWWEEYDKDVKDPVSYGKEVIDYFNSTLIPGEKPRKYLDCVVLDEHSIKDHKWIKTSMVTKQGRLGLYDTYKCERCGVTAKRYLGSIDSFTLDSKYKAKVYQRCDTAMKHLEKKSLKRRQDNKFNKRRVLRIKRRAKDE